MKNKIHPVKQFDLSLTHSCREIPSCFGLWKQEFFSNMDMRSAAKIMRKTKETKGS